MADQLSIRTAIESDVPRLKELGVQGWETAYASFIRPENREAYLAGDFWSIERLRSVVEDPTAVNLVAERGCHIVGFITTERLDNGPYEVTRLYVARDTRSRGVGARLLHSAFDQLRTFRIADVLVNVFGDNLAGRRFYERHGFELIEDTFTTVGDQVVSDVWYRRGL
jgi:diamine N-acetyltransferase